LMASSTAGSTSSDLLNTSIIYIWGNIHDARIRFSSQYF
jgi:hypothetical protein